MANKVLITIGEKTYQVIGDPIIFLARQGSVVKSVTFEDRLFDVKEVQNG